MRRVLETLARRRPLVLVVDDLQWAEPAFVELVEHVAEWARDAPLLLLVMARPELLDDAAGVGRRQAQRDVDPARAACRRRRRAICCTTSSATRPARGQPRRAILEVAEGNPLFVEEVVAMLVDEAAARQVGRADCRDRRAADDPGAARGASGSPARDERAVIEAAAVEGKEFAAERVAALLGRRESSGELRALVRTHLIRPAGATEGGFRFHHQLIRDARVRGHGQGARAELHERFADWLERASRGGSPVATS